MTLPIGAVVDIAEALEDTEITQQEVEGLLVGVFNSFIAGIVLAFGMSMMVKAVGKSSPAVGLVEDVEEVGGVAGLASML